MAARACGLAGLVLLSIGLAGAVPQIESIDGPRGATPGEEIEFRVTAWNENGSYPAATAVATHDGERLGSYSFLAFEPGSGGSGPLTITMPETEKETIAVTFTLQNDTLGETYDRELFNITVNGTADPDAAARIVRFERSTVTALGDTLAANVTVLNTGKTALEGRVILSIIDSPLRTAMQKGDPIPAGETANYTLFQTIYEDDFTGRNSIDMALRVEADHGTVLDRRTFTVPIGHNDTDNTTRNRTTNRTWNHTTNRTNTTWNRTHNRPGPTVADLQRRLERKDRRIAALERRVASLRATVARLRSQIQRLNRSPPDSGDGATPPDAAPGNRSDGADRPPQTPPDQQPMPRDRGGIIGFLGGLLG